MKLRHLKFIIIVYIFLPYIYTLKTGLIPNFRKTPSYPYVWNH